MPIGAFGIHPRTVIGAIGILTSPFLHANMWHLLMNTAGVLTFGFLFAAIEGRQSRRVIWFIIFVQGTLTWFFARSGNHIGASGLVFGLFGYLATFGLFHRRLLYLAISVVVCLMYGGMLFGMLPLRALVSWEAHLFGFIAGVLAARFHSRV